MVRRAARLQPRLLARLLAAALLVLPLTTCIFVLSPFPATLSQVVAKADLSSVIPSGSGNGYQPYVVLPAGGEFVILMNRFSGSDPAVIVLDSNLGFIQAYTYSWLTSWGYTGGGVALTDAARNAAIGSVWFSAAELANVGWNPSGTLSGARIDYPGFSSPTAQKNDVNFSVTSGNTLGYQQYQWWSGTLDFPQPTLQINSAGGSYYVQAVYNVDDTPSGGEIILVLADQNNSSNVTLVGIPLAQVLGNTVQSPLLGNYPSRSLTSSASSSVGFAGDCIVAYSQNSRELKRYSLSTFEEIQSLPIGKSEYYLQYAYSPSGGYSVVYDPVARTITKVANWW